MALRSVSELLDDLVELSLARTMMRDLAGVGVAMPFRVLVRVLSSDDRAVESVSFRSLPCKNSSRKLMMSFLWRVCPRMCRWSPVTPYFLSCNST